MEGKMNLEQLNAMTDFSILSAQEK